MGVIEMKRRDKVYYLLIIISAILFIIGIGKSMEEKRIVKILNHYEEVDKIVIIKNKDKYEVSKSNFSSFKNLLEPLDIVSKKNGREITKELGDKIIEIEYYIGKQKLLKSGIYSLNHKPQVDELEHFYFEVDSKYYTTMVDGTFISINDKNMEWLSQYL
jgi:hypothetical protein